MRSLTTAFLVGAWCGVVLACWIGWANPATPTYLVYTEESPSPWRVKSLDEAEKKAHFLVYEGDAKLALITDTDNRVVSQVRKGDGRDVGSD